MPTTIRKSQIGDPEAFARRVSQHAEDLNHHAAHHDALEEEKSREPDVAKRQYQPYPVPTAHPMIAAAVVRISGKFSPAYEVLDDIPPPPAALTDDDVALRRKKAELVDFVAHQESAHLGALMPSGKLRARYYRSQDIAEAEEGRRRALAATMTKEEIVAGAPAKTVLAERSPEDAAFLAEESELHERMRKIQRHAARLQHDVEDLTSETIDTWTMEPFPTWP